MTVFGKQTRQGTINEQSFYNSLQKKYIPFIFVNVWQKQWIALFQIVVKNKRLLYLRMLRSAKSEIEVMEMTVRIESLRKKVEELRYDAYLVTDAMNVRYLTGIPEPQSPYLLIKHDGDHVLYVLSDGLRASELYVGSECEVQE